MNVHEKEGDKQIKQERKSPFLLGYFRTTWLSSCDKFRNRDYDTTFVSHQQRALGLYMRLIHG